MTYDNINQRLGLTVSRKGGLQKSILFCFSCLVIAVLFEPAYFEQTNSFIHIPYVLLKYACSFFVIIAFLGGLIANKIKMNSFILAFLAFEAVLLTTTILNMGNGATAFSSWFANGAYSIVLVLFLQIVFDYNPKLLFSSFSVVLGTYVHLNTICRVLFPDGMYILRFGTYRTPLCWLLGYDNVAVVIILVVQIICLYRISLNKGKSMLWDWSVVISGIYFMFVQIVATAILAEVLFFAFLISCRNTFFREHFAKAKLVVVVMFAMFFVVQMISFKESRIINFIFLMMGKDTTFTGRTWIWSRAIRDIINGHIITGYGAISSTVMRTRIGSDAAVHAHSYYLQVLYEGGVIAFIAIFILLIISAKRFDKGERNASSFVILAGLSAIMLSWQVEASNNLVKFSVIVLFILYHAVDYEKLASRKSDVPKRRRGRIRI